MSQAISFDVFKDGQFIQQKTFGQGVVKIGKLDSSHLCLEDSDVARMHAVIEISGSDVRVVDLGSTSGTSVNQERVEKSAALGDGDRVAIGPYEIAVRKAPRPSRPQAPQVHIDSREVERTDGSTVTEVMALYGRTVLDVQHVGQTKSRRASAPVFLGLGGLLLLGGAGLFAHDAIAEDWSGYQEARMAAAEAGRPEPTEPGWGTGGLGITLALLGLVPLGIGTMRLGDKGISAYTIGEGHSANFSMPAEGLPNRAAHPLVSGGESGAPTLNFTPEMTGQVTIEGKTATLEDLVASGHAHKQGGGYALPLPSSARCRVAHNGMTFHVNVVPPGKSTAARTETDKPFWLYSAASLVVVGSLLGLSQLAMPGEDAMNLDDQHAENRFVGYVHQPDEAADEDPVPEEVATDSKLEAGGSGKRHAGDEGAMGKPTSKQRNRAYSMKGPKDAVQQLSRNFDPDMQARESGILGLIQEQSGNVIASPYGGAFSVGNQDEDIWGNLTGTEVGEAYGVGGIGLIGAGRGGGGNGEGTIGLGNVGTIGHAAGGGTGLRYGRGSGVGLDKRKKRVPRPRIGKPTIRGALDKSIIRRIVRSHINQVRHCYNQGLVKDPNLRGRVSVQFTIGPTGKVPASVVGSTTLSDRSTANCVAKAVKRWKFPRPPGGGNVIVTYPFVLDPA